MSLYGAFNPPLELYRTIRRVGAALSPINALPDCPRKHIRVKGLAKKPAVPASNVSLTIPYSERPDIKKIGLLPFLTALRDCQPFMAASSHH